jgi:2-methylcitrate dehydratase PrpD
LAAGSKSQLGTTTIHLHTGLAAHNGVLATALAGVGATGSVDALDGDWGTLRLLADGDAPGFDIPLSKLGDPLAIVEFGLCVKPYPCCSYTTSAIDGVLSLRAEHGLTPNEVAEVIAHIPARNIELLKFPKPENELEARFSMEFCLAVALHRGAVLVADFTPTAIAEKKVRALLPRIRMEALPETAEHENVTILLHDGRTLERTVEHPRGSAALPFSEDELLAKFDSCMDGVLGVDDATALKQALINIESLDDIRDLTQYLSLAN